MTQKTYIVEGRQFRTEADYRRAAHDKEIIDKLRKAAELYDVKQLAQLKKAVRDGKYSFMTILGRDFEDELDEMIRECADGRRTAVSNNKTAVRGKTMPHKSQKQVQPGRKPVSAMGEVPDAYVMEELRRQERRRKLMIALCSLLAVGCLGYFGVYTYYSYRTDNSYAELNELKEKPVIHVQQDTEPVIHYTSDEAVEPKEVLDEYKNLLNKNKKLIGWVKIDDTNIDYPVMQTTDNEYYQDHNMNQEYDKNGSIFMDKDCDVLKPSTNYILYGHHMKSGKMFGKLHLYEDKDYYEEHKYIEFDTIYEKGLYEVMYVFRSRVYSESEVVFKYYQFIDAHGEKEFDSNMQEMANMSLYDTGVTAQYGDQLLTLSTCDYQEKNGRFVVVAKKVAAKE